MESFGLYLLKSAIWLTGFALVFLLILRNERYFRLNRVFLLSGIVASIVFPFYTWHYAVILPYMPEANISVSGLTAVAISSETTTLPIYWWFYLAGIALFVFRLTRQTWMVIRKLRKAGYVKNGPVKLVRTSEYAASFSFFSFVFVNPSTTDIEMKEIVIHEREHIQQHHWFDLLLVELLCMLQWFNPFVWIYSRLIRQNHEFLADEMALQSTSNPAIYHATLLNQMLGVPVIDLANSFSYSINKKRFKMMKKKINSPFRKLKVLLVLPIMVLVFYAFAKPEYISPAQAFPTDKVNVSADGQKVKGKVVNPDGKPLGGTSVIIKGSTIGTITDNNGEFELKDVPKDGELVFSYVGLHTTVLKVDIDKPMSVKMISNAVGLEKVVVVGYVNPSGPPPPPPPSPFDIDSKNPPIYFLDGVLIDKAKMDAINPEEIQSVSVLKGEDATKKYDEKGKNGAIEITMKNSHSVPPPPPPYDPKNPPLYILDGVIIDPSKMNVKPDDIERIDVLKEKSATEVYGDKGKNGVVLITSKKKGVQIRLTDGSQTKPSMYFIGGVEKTKDEFEKIDSNSIESVNVLKGDYAVKKYGEKGRDGVIEVKLKTDFGVNDLNKDEKKVSKPE